jgi:hypothetical protein
MHCPLTQAAPDAQVEPGQHGSLGWPQGVSGTSATSTMSTMSCASVMSLASA